MFSRVPVVSSRLEGISAIMTNEKEGLLASVGDVNDFSRQLQRLEASPELGQLLAANARSKALEQFSASVTAGRIEDIYRRELAIANSKLADKSSGS
jgi:glycosyltransferase involved in cell wall biosynthesis